MKKFHFPLDRILDWRRTQVRMEQIKLERMLAELRQLELQAASVLGERETAQRAVVQSSSSLGSELQAFSSYRTASGKRSAALERDRSASLERIRAQREVLSLKERDVRLLEKLREDRLHQWHLEQDREIDQQAAESHLGRWGKDRI
jgi:flagellar export protein FliJ